MCERQVAGEGVELRAVEAGEEEWQEGGGVVAADEVGGRAQTGAVVGTAVGAGGRPKDGGPKDGGHNGIGRRGGGGGHGGSGHGRGVLGAVRRRPVLLDGPTGIGELSGILAGLREVRGPAGGVAHRPT